MANELVLPDSSNWRTAQLGSLSRVEIQDPQSNRNLDYVALRLTRSEASELRDKLGGLLEAGDSNRHSHVASKDFQVEISIWLDDDA